MLPGITLSVASTTHTTTILEKYHIGEARTDETPWSYDRQKQMTQHAPQPEAPPALYPAYSSYPASKPPPTASGRALHLLPAQSSAGWLQATSSPPSPTSPLRPLTSGGTAHPSHHLQPQLSRPETTGQPPPSAAGSVIPTVVPPCPPWSSRHCRAARSAVRTVLAAAAGRFLHNVYGSSRCTYGYQYLTRNQTGHSAGYLSSFCFGVRTMPAAAAGRFLHEAHGPPAIHKSTTILTSTRIAFCAVVRVVPPEGRPLQAKEAQTLIRLLESPFQAPVILTSPTPAAALWTSQHLRQEHVSIFYFVMF